MIVLDASGAVEIARGTERGQAAQKLLAEDEEIVSCDLLHAEVANAFYKYARAGFIDAGEARARTEAALDLVGSFYPLSAMDIEVIGESVRLNHPVYDIYYLVLARRLGATLLTFDNKLNALCEHCGVPTIGEIKL